ncbi:MAG: cadmium-translocating P-type ATPase [Deltaproteobacteria bacterium RBG_16_71_12]|nr:MAG: cadmium-translocating P-type ATPase [Deltaproteobacteria bacterium RBG_16_71_12]
MDCAEEVATLKQALVPLLGEEKLAFDVLRGRLIVDMTGAKPGERDVLAAIAKTGLRAEPFSKTPAGPSIEARRRTTSTIAGAALLAIAFMVHVGLEGFKAALGSEGMGVAHTVPWAVRILYLVTIVTSGWIVFPKAVAAARRLRPDMNFLMTIAVIGAVAIGEYFEAATVTVLFAISLALESWSVGRARRAIEALLSLAPPTARVKRDGKEIELAPADLSIGEVFVVRPGERIALDGTIIAGASAINQAPVTGESAPVEKTIGAQVFAGTVNGDGALDVRVSKVAEDSTVAHIARLVEDAQSKRSRSEKFVERFAAIYTPVVLALAVLTAVVPPLVFHGDWSGWLYKALVLLVIGCPCALVISTPVAIVAGLAAAASRGVLVKSGEHLETPAGLKAIALDKTGTLTTGRPKVVDVVPFDEHDRKSLLRIAASLESKSEHPIAHAVVQAALAEGIEPPPVEGFVAVRGKGASGVVEGEEHWLGSHRFLDEKKQETPEAHKQLEALSADGKTIVVVGNARHVCGFITVADEIRPDASANVAALRAAGIEHIVMLTGDNAGTARAVARLTGVLDVRAELMPEDKLKIIDELRQKYGEVAMVGDGVNDAPAMAKASLGIAMGAVGSDAAIEAADVALMSDDLSAVPWLVAHARRVVSIVRQNIAFAIAVKIVVVGLTAVGTASLWMAIAADMGASLIVVANGVRLLRGVAQAAK